MSYRLEVGLCWVMRRCLVSYERYEHYQAYKLWDMSYEAYKLWVMRITRLVSYDLSGLWALLDAQGYLAIRNLLAKKADERSRLTSIQAVFQKIK